jgi:hypothetical protein
MRPGAVSWETADLIGSEPLAVGMSSPLGFSGVTVAAATAAYVAPPSGDTTCQPTEGACSSVALDELAGNGADPCAWRWGHSGRLRLDARVSQLIFFALARSTV